MLCLALESIIPVIIRKEANIITEINAMIGCINGRRIIMMMNNIRQERDDDDDFFNNRKKINGKSKFPRLLGDTPSVNHPVMSAAPARHVSRICSLRGNNAFAVRYKNTMYNISKIIVIRLTIGITPMPRISEISAM